VRKFSIEAVARQLLEKAEQSRSQRAAETVYGGSECVLRQTVVALAAGAEMAEHDNPGESTVQVLTGRIQLIAGEQMWEGRQSTMLVVPNARHKVVALTPATFLLTVVKARS